MLCGPLFFQKQAWAGAQAEEPLADSVRSALHASIEFRAPVRQERESFPTTESYLAYLRWLTTMSDRIRRRKTDFQTQIERQEFLETVWYESKRRGLEPSLVLGLIQVESGFRKNAYSSAGAMGYMQVMPFWTRTIGNGDLGKLYNMQVNLRFGCVILRHYLDLEKGNLFMALGRYNGSRGKPQYPDAVFAAQKLWR
jgi:soluble lytic murein transglycosylase-like protein